MRLRSAIVLGIVVSTLCIAPITVSAERTSSGPAGVASLSPITAQDGMNETTTDDGMGNESMDDSTNETTMSDGNMSDGMGETTMANESMDDSMGNETSTEMMNDGNATADDGDESSAFAPGFGLLTVLLAVVAIALYAARGR